MKAIAFRHAATNCLGSLASTLELAGIEWEYIDAYREDVSGVDPLEHDLMIMLGGSPGVYQADIYEFMKHEINILEKRLAADKPTLGICLGAQLMAKALGADVYIGEAGPEKGWFDLTLYEAAADSPVRHLGPEHTKMLQWHGDTFDLPEGATLLASSQAYKNQIYSWGENALALQGHAEVTNDILQAWFVSAAGQVQEGKLDLHKIRRDTEAYLNTLIGQTDKFMREWLDSLPQRQENQVA